MSLVQSSSLSAAVELKSSVDYVVIDADLELAVFKHTRGSVIEGSVLPVFQRLVVERSTQGIATLEDVLKVSRGEAFEVQQLGRSAMLSKETIALAEKEGWKALDDYKVFQEQPFDAIVSGERSAEDVYVVDRGSMDLYDRKGVALPIARTADYMSGYFDNSHYDLNVALKILKEDKRIWFKKAEVQGIPHYNASEERSAHIAFRFSPTRADVIRIQYSLKKGETVHSAFWAKVFELDLLGLRAGGAALTEEFWD